MQVMFESFNGDLARCKLTVKNLVERVWGSTLRESYIAYHKPFTVTVQVAHPCEAGDGMLDWEVGRNKHVVEWVVINTSANIQYEAKEVCITKHIGKLYCTKWYDLLNTYIMLSDMGSVDTVKHSMYICTYYSNKWVHCYNASVHILNI